METTKKTPATGPVMLMCALTILFGAYNVIITIVGFISAATQGAAISGNPGEIALIAMLFLVGLLQICAGVVGILGIKNEAFRQRRRQLGYLMLVVTAAYIVSTMFIRGFAWSTVYGLILAAAYLSIIKAD